MADSILMAPDVQAEQQRITRQQAMAQALMQQGMQNSGGTQQIGGVAIRNSPVSGLAQMFNAYLGGKLQNKADTQQTSLDQNRRTALADSLRAGLGQTDPTQSVINLSQNPDTAPYAAAAYANLLKNQNEQNKPLDLGDVAKYDPQSVAKFKQTGNYADLQLADKVAAPMTDFQRQSLEIDRQRLGMQKDQQVDNPNFTPAAIDNAAARYNIDGTLPPMGMGKNAAAGRSAILNRAAELAASSGVSADDQRINQIGNKANTAALSKIQQQQTMVGAFEKNFNRNADIALELSGKVDRTGVPIANKWLNAGKRAVAGDPDLAAFDASVKAVSNEYAKIVSGSMGNTAVAEGEIKKIEGLLNAAQTPEQLTSVINLMKRETQNRMKGFDEEKASLRTSMKGNKSDERPQRLKFNPATGQLE